MGLTYVYTTYDGVETYIDAASLTFRGLWLTATSYAAFDVVDQGTAKYIALQSSNSTPPSGNLTEYWSVITQKYVPTPEPDPTPAQAVSIIIGTLRPTSYTEPLYLRHDPSEDVVYMTQSGTATDGWLSAYDYTRIFYISPSITSFTNSIGTVEIGSSIANVTLNWAVNKVMTSQTLSPGGSVTPPTATLIIAGPWTADQTFGLTVGDGTSTDSASTPAYFLNKMYWGANASATVVDANILALSSAFATSRSTTKVITAAGQYIYICYPASFGTASFTVNGLPNTAWTLSVQSFTNASGYTVNYNVYRSDNLLTGTYTIGVS